MRILVTGIQGQVARSLVEVGPMRGHDVIALGRPDIDLADDEDTIVKAIIATAADAVISAAAYTAVDKAEDEPNLAYAINARGAGAVAKAATQLGVPLVHFSTDYVFDGKQERPYVESDPTGPAGAYGKSKLGGERLVAQYCQNAAILRCAWVFSPFGANFVRTMLRLAESREELGVVADQFGNPTSALDIATGSLHVAENLIADARGALRGVFHMTGTGATSWAGFAEAVFAASREASGPTARVNHITTAEFPTKATRPANSQLDCALLARAHGVSLPPWQASLEPVVRRLLAS